MSKLRLIVLVVCFIAVLCACVVPTFFSVQSIAYAIDYIGALYTGYVYTLDDNRFYYSSGQSWQTSGLTKNGSAADFAFLRLLIPGINVDWVVTPKKINAVSVWRNTAVGPNTVVDNAPLIRTAWISCGLANSDADFVNAQNFPHVIGCLSFTYNDIDYMFTYDVMNNFYTSSASTQICYCLFQVINGAFDHVVVYNTVYAINIENYTNDFTLLFSPSSIDFGFSSSNTTLNNYLLKCRQYGRLPQSFTYNVYNCGLGIIDPLWEDYPEWSVDLPGGSTVEGSANYQGITQYLVFGNRDTNLMYIEYKRFVDDEYTPVVPLASSPNDTVISQYALSTLDKVLIPFADCYIHAYTYELVQDGSGYSRSLTSIDDVYHYTAPNNGISYAFYGEFLSFFYDIQSTLITEDGYQAGYEQGVLDGYAAIYNHSFNLQDTMFAVFAFPWRLMFGQWDSVSQNYVNGLFTFTVLGVDIRAFLLGFLSVILVVRVVGFALGKR